MDRIWKRKDLGNDSVNFIGNFGRLSGDSYVGLLRHPEGTSMSYEGVMRLAREHPSSRGTIEVDWLKVVRGCYEEAKSYGRGNRFAGSWVYKRQEVGWFPNLRMLDEKYGILRKVGQTRKYTFYVMPDMEGVARALSELGYL